MQDEATALSVTGSLAASPQVLLVEDSEMQRKLFGTLFRRAGFRVLEAHTGGEALATMRRESPDVVVLDILLPDTNGHELCATIRKFPEWGSVPIIMLTCLEEIDHKVKALSKGADDYVGKSANPQELVARVKRILQRVQVQNQLTEEEKLETLHRAASTLAHGINNPLQVLSMSVEMLENRLESDPDALDLLDRMQGHVSRIKQLVTNLRQVSQIVEDPNLDDFNILQVPESSEDQTQLRRRPDSYQILVVDDESDIRNVVRATLEASGRFEVLEAETGEEALEIVRATRPDVVLLDIMLPGIDGYGVCKAIKSDQQLRVIPVIMLTAMASVRDMVRSFELGAANYVVKPIDPTRLSEQIFRTMERTGVRVPSF